MKEMNKTRKKDRAVTSLEQPETSSIMMTEPITIEEDVEFKSKLLNSTSNVNSGSKPRQHLTEAEKEARRLCRVLANRESARQTIRRRQVMFEELTRKAADLAAENDNLKKDKELAMKEYGSLKSTNDYLKAQVADMMKAEAEIEEKSWPSNSETSSSVPTTTSFPCNLGPVLPVHWPSVFQPSDISFEQCRSGGCVATPLVPTMQLWKPDSFLAQRNSVTIPNPGTLLCVLPFPCLFPVHAAGGACHSQSFELDEKQNETATFHQCNGSASAKQTWNIESYLPLKVKTEVLNPAGSTSAEHAHQADFGFPPDGGGDGEGTCHQGMVLVPAPLNCIRPVASVRPFTALHHQDDTPNAVAVLSSGGHNGQSSLQENKEETIQLGKKTVDSIAAAEARKRRRELIKLKNVHAHQ